MIGVVDEIQFINHSDHNLIDTQPSDRALPDIVRTTVNGLFILIYDINDKPTIHTDLLDTVNLYFKRSYSKELHTSISSKIRPYGLNHFVASSSWEIDQFQRITRYYKGFTLLKELLHYLLRRGFPNTSKFGVWPDLECPPKVLFMVRLWPLGHIHNDLSIEAIQEINNNRVDCIRMLKSKLGEDNFFGGLQRDEYSEDYAPDLILDSSTTKRSNYFDIISKHSICISTTGLHGSIGWKLAEYVGLSKAILSEPLVYEVPGDFSADKNYIEFSDPEDCAEKAKYLLENKDVVDSMMIENYKYYHKYQRPDSLILNSLIQLLEEVINK